MTRQRLEDFHDLMRHRVMDVLLVASPYDAFVLEEAGQLSERMLGEFRNLDLHYGPGLTTVATGEEALALAAAQPRFNLVITTLQLGDMNAAELARRARAAGLDIPVVALAFDNQELTAFLARHDASAVDRVFLWQGDARILWAIVKDVEDRLNVAHDTGQAGVQVILLIEDNVRYYSSFLPTIYAELLHQSQQVTAEGRNLAEKITRMRARPKILLCRTFEEARRVFETYRDNVLGVIADVEFPRAGHPSPEAGLEFARLVRSPFPDVPVLLQSARPENDARARALGTDFLLKGSPRLLQELRRFMTDYFGFGPFVFRTPDGAEAGRAGDLRGLLAMLATVPAESIAYHAERNHFSKWLKARTEFSLAHQLRPRTVREFGTAEGLRRHLIDAVAGYRRERRLLAVADFDPDDFDPASDFARIGGGSLGGKARGLAFMRQLLGRAGLSREFPEVSVRVPPAVVLATDVFDRFLEENALLDFAMEADDDEALLQRFLAARFPREARRHLLAFLRQTGAPMAIRSSSLLEDSPYQPFTGVYDTFMVANDEARPETRLSHVVAAVKRVYASTFSQRARRHMRATPFRLEEEKMAVIVQRVAGTAHGRRFYPDLAGSARSHDFYPVAPLTARDGVAAVALGLGRTVVDGGRAVRFCPRAPERALQERTARQRMDGAQQTFWALQLGGPSTGEVELPLSAADEDGTLAPVASTWSAENDALYDGTSRTGLRVVTFAPILKDQRFPLARLIARMLDLGAWGMGAPVEIEFAATLAGARPEFALLQLRPMALSREQEDVEIGDAAEDRVLCRSRRVMGHGRVEVRDLVVVDRAHYDRSRSREAAAAIALFNEELAAAGRSYFLIGVGRWGSRDPWLGIPVRWEEISSARVIVETDFRDLRVEPSQGTHFFQNLTSFHVGYFTVHGDGEDGAVDWDWVAAQPAAAERGPVRHLRFPRPLMAAMDGRTGEGLVLKPEPETGARS